MTEALDTAPETQTLRIERHFEAKPELLYRCFLEAEHLAAWFGPERVVCSVAKVDAWVGGAYELTMHNTDGTEIGLVGQYLELEEPSLIKMTWRWKREDDSDPGEETLVTIRFKEAEGGTLMQLKHERFGESSERDRHGSGWESSFVCLDEHLAVRSA